MYIMYIFELLCFIVYYYIGIYIIKWENLVINVLLVIFDKLYVGFLLYVIKGIFIFVIFCSKLV